MSDVTTSTYTASGSDTYGKGMYEDVEGIIQMISPSKTPFISSIGTGKATNTYHEWLEDELKSPTGTNKAVEGADATSTTRTPPSRKGNYTQIIEDTFKLSGTQTEGPNHIGRKSLRAYETEKSMKYVNTEIEYAAINNATSAAGDASTARQMKGMAGFISTNDKSYSSYAATNDFSETKLMEMSQACYEQGGDPSVLLLGPVQARKVSDWDGNGRITVNTNASEKVLTMAVMVLETPFGRMKVAIDRYIAPYTYTTPDPDEVYNTVFVYDPAKFSLATLRPFRSKRLGDAGDNEKWQSVWEGTLVCHNEKAAAKCAKCATD